MIGVWQKAAAAARSAHLLLEAGDTDGAVNRAYYAMFDAARSALMSMDPKLAEAKTHATVIRRFGLHLVKAGHFDSELGRILNQTEELRLSADYESDPTGIAEARLTIEKMDEFVAAISAFLASRQP